MNYTPNQTYNTSSGHKASRALLSLLLALAFSAAAFGTSASADSITDDTPLRVDEAYKLAVLPSGAEDDGKNYVVEFTIEEGYYLYKDKFYVIPGPIAIEASDNVASITDQFFGKQDIYRNFARFAITLPEGASDGFIVNYQGCWDQGLCYPVQSRLVSMVNGAADIIEITGADVEGNLAGDPLVIDSLPAIPENSHQFYLNKLRNSSTLLIIFLFFLAGLGLTFTPCVLPMLPIISGLVTRRNDEGSTQWRRISLALTYVVVMSLMFSLLGLFSGLAGSGLRDLLGSQIFLVTMASLITLMALSMLNLLRIPVPAFINKSVNNYLDSDTGAYSKAAIWGFLSPFIAGTCLSAPLAGALIYLAEQGNPWLGVWSLLALGWGMGLPLLLFAVGLGQFMPSSGPWLVVFRNILALTLFALAIFILSPLLPPYVEIFSYILLLAGMIYLLLRSILNSRFSNRQLQLAVGLLALVVGIFYVVSVSQQEELDIQVVADYATMEEVIANSAATNTPQVLYYYADWCVSCRELEWVVLRDEEVQQQLAEINFTKLDITKASSDTKMMSQKFDIFGPPTLIFIDASGKQRQDLTLIGNFDKTALLARIEALTN